MKPNIYGFIYILENDVNSKLYVGQTLDLEKRKRTHFSDSSRTWAIKAAIEKYGADNFDFVILEACFSEEELNRKERHWIRNLKTIAPFGYNLKEGGKSGRPSKIVRDKMSASRRGKKLSMSHKQAIGASLKGRVVSDTARQKISNSHKGLTHSETSRLKMSKSHKGKKVSAATRQKMSISQKGKHKDPKSAEHKLKISVALKGRQLSAEHRQKISQALVGNKNATK